MIQYGIKYNITRFPKRMKNVIIALSSVQVSSDLQTADKDGDQKLNVKEAKDALFEEHGIEGSIVEPMVVDDDVDGDGLLDATEFVSTRTTVRRLAIENAGKLLQVSNFSLLNFIDKCNVVRYRNSHLL